MTALLIGLCVSAYFLWLWHEFNVAPYGREIPGVGFVRDEPGAADAALGHSNGSKS